MNDQRYGADAATPEEQTAPSTPRANVSGPCLMPTLADPDSLLDSLPLAYGLTPITYNPLTA